MVVQSRESIDCNNARLEEIIRNTLGIGVLLVSLHNFSNHLKD